MKRKGFTLIELLVVIAIIGILATIGLVALNGAREKARDATRKSDISQIKTALTLYADDNGNAFPAAVTAVTSSTTGPTGSGTGIFNTASASNPILPEYLSKAPQDPTSNGTYHYTYATCAIGNAHYVLYSALESPASSYFWVKWDGTSGDKDLTAPLCT